MGCRLLEAKGGMLGGRHRISWRLQDLLGCHLQKPHPRVGHLIPTHLQVQESPRKNEPGASGLAHLQRRRCRRAWTARCKRFCKRFYQVYQDLLIDNYYLLLLHNLNFAEKSEFLGALLNAQQHKDALPSHNAQQDQGLSPQH